MRGATDWLLERTARPCDTGDPVVANVRGEPPFAACRNWSARPRGWAALPDALLCLQFAEVDYKRQVATCLRCSEKPLQCPPGRLTRSTPVSVVLNYQVLMPWECLVLDLLTGRVTQSCEVLKNVLAIDHYLAIWRRAEAPGWTWLVGHAAEGLAGVIPNVVELVRPTLPVYEATGGAV